MENNNGGGESASSEVVKTKATTAFFPDKGHVTDALRTILANLGASHLTLLFEKRLKASDRNKGQHRLLMSCKCESKRASFDSIFTETEMQLVQRPEEEEDDEQGKQRRSTFQGLAVQAYDCDGRMYELALKYLSCNTGYRIVGSEWTVFLQNNGLFVAGGGVTTRKPSAAGRRRQKKRRRSSLPEEEPNDDEQIIAVRDADDDDDIQMEVWAFRSPKLSIGVKEQPGGALGLLLLHYRGGGGEAGTEEVQVVTAAPLDQEAVVVVDVEQPQRNSHGGTPAQGGEDMVAAGDCAGNAATVVDDAAGKLGDDDAAPRSTRDMPLGPIERLAAVWLSFHDHSDNAHGNDNRPVRLDYQRLPASD